MLDFNVIWIGACKLLLLYSSQAAVETRALVQEVAERHDIIVKLKNEINDLEQQLKRKDTHIQFKDEIIKELRQHRRPNVKVTPVFTPFLCLEALLSNE